LPTAAARRAPVAGVLLLAVTACAGRAAPGTLPLPPGARASAETGPLLVCAAEVAAEVGLPVIEQRAERGELRALSADWRGATPAAGRLDVVTVRIGNKVSQGLRVLAQTFRRRGPSSAVGGAWEAERPSLEAGLARDAILRRCGTLDDAPAR
jgi:hypothetical protein